MLMPLAFQQEAAGDFEAARRGGAARRPQIGERFGDATFRAGGHAAGHMLIKRAE